MRIAQIAPSQIPNTTANSLQGMKMAQAFTERGHNLRLYAPGANPAVPWEQLAQDYGLRAQFEIEWLPSRSLLRHYDYARSAVNAARRWGADLIYTRLPQAAAYAAGRSIPTIHEIHDTPKGRGGPRLLRAFLGANGAERLVVITQALAEALQARYDVPNNNDFLLIAPDGVDLERYAQLPDPAAARRQLNLADQFTAGYTGHLYTGRGVDLILAIARQLPQMHFLIAGGRRQDVLRVQEELRAHSIQNVTLTGFVPNAEIPLYQAASDVLLMPYQSQVAASSGGDIAAYLSPMKLFEYLASGRPILASRLPVLGEVLNTKNAILLPGDDLGEWVTALQALQSAPGRRQKLGAAARASAQGYSWRARAEAILAGLA